MLGSSIYRECFFLCLHLRGVMIRFANVSIFSGEMEVRMKRNRDRGVETCLDNAYVYFISIRGGVQVYL